MRIISGIAKGKRLRSPRGMAIRPTSDRVKEALFDILMDRIEGSLFLDLFAGTGSIGIESLSRGARKTIFVEKNRLFFKIIRENLISSSLISQGDIYLSEAIGFIRRMERGKRRFDIIFADPPYHTGDLERIIHLFSHIDILNRDGLIVFEHFHKVRLDRYVGRLELYKEYSYGDSILTIYSRRE